MLRLITSNFATCLLLTAVSGAMAIAMWELLIAVLGKRKQFGMVFSWIPVALFCNVVPLAYLLGKGLLWLNPGSEMPMGDGLWCVYGDATMKVIYISLMIWFVGLLIVIIHIIEEKYRLDRLVAWNEVVKDERIMASFERAKKKVGLKRHVTVYRNTLIHTPMTLTWHKQVILIPEQEYTDKELQVIFCHELLHIKSGDHRKKKWLSLIVCVFWFNPFVWRFYKQMNRWCETECDYKVTKLLEGQMSVNEYFLTLLDIVQHSSRNWFLFTSFASSSKEELERRFLIVEGSLRKKDMKKGTIAVTTVLLVSLMGSTVYAAGLQADEMIAQSAMDQVVEYEEVYVPAECEETTEYLTDAQMAAITVDDTVVIPEADTRALSDVNWTVEAGQKTRGAFVYLSQGTKVTMAGLLNPNDVQIKVGLLCSDNALTTIRATSQFAHTFNISWSGFFAIYVENMGTETVTVRILVEQE